MLGIIVSAAAKLNENKTVSMTLSNRSIMVFRFMVSNARRNGLGMMAAFLRLFAKMVIACPNPLAGACYAFLLRHCRK